MSIDVDISVWRKYIKIYPVFLFFFIYLLLGGSIVKDIIDDDLEFDLIPHISFIGFCNSSHLTTGEERIGTLELLSSRSHHWLSNTFLQKQRERIVGKFSSIPIDSALYIYITNLTNNMKNKSDNNSNNNNVPTLCDSGYIAAIAIDSVFQMFNKSLEQPIQPPYIYIYNI